MARFFEKHIADVRKISDRVRSFFESGQKFRIYKGSTNSTRASTFKKHEVVDIGTLNRILEINQQKKYIVTEPNVSMGALVKATLRHSLVPPVVPEFSAITIGGGVQGGAAESSSFKYGLMHNACLEYEMVLGNGDIITVSREKNPDLFWGTACSYGSLGIITKVKMQLIPAKKFVKVAYTAIHSFSEAIELGN